MSKTTLTIGILLILAGTTVPSALAQAARRAPGPAIIPQPARMELKPGAFAVCDVDAIVVKDANADTRKVADALASLLHDTLGRTVPVRTNGATTEDKLVIRMELVPDNADKLGPEGYRLSVAPDGVVLEAVEPRGLFWGVQTLRQLLPPPAKDADKARQARATLPALNIVDRPRYSWRGMHLDVCRHMMPVEFVKEYIDLLALYKMNTFHWHLTEDQGWRIEIRKYPKLTEIGAWRMQDGKRYGGYYTQDQIRDVVRYAADRFITVVPEIEMPGHSQAALAAYPELSCTGGPFEVGATWGIYKDVYCAGNDKTFEFLQDVLTEVMELFPGTFIHVGGDECPKDRWEKCPKCQARIQAEGLKDEHELQSYFIHRIAKFIDAHGRRLIGWDEILEGGLAPTATVMSWRGTKGGIAAAKMGHDVVMSPTSHCYFNFRQIDDKEEFGYPRAGAITLKMVYDYEPTPAELGPEEAKHVLGAQGNLWSEYFSTPDEAEYMAFPRVCALAEVVWTPAGQRNWDSFLHRMRIQAKRLEAMGVNYCRKALEDVPASE